MVLSLLFLNSALGTLLPPVCKVFTLPYASSPLGRVRVVCFSHSSLHTALHLLPSSLGGFPVMHTLCFVHTPVTKTVHCVRSVHRSCTLAWL